MRITGVLLLFLFSMVLKASPVEISEARLLAEGEISLFPEAQLRLGEDPSPKAPEPSKPLASEAVEGDRVNLGYGAQTAWVRFDLRNTSASPVAAVLRLHNPTLDRVTLYAERNGSYVPVAKSGIMTLRPYDDGIIEPHFAIDLPPRALRRYLLQVHTESSALRFAPRLASPSAFSRGAIRAQMFRSLFFGAMGALILYNFFIFLFTRERAYLYYTLYHLFAVVNYLSYTSTINDLIPPSLWKLDAYLAVFYQNAGMLFLLLFARSFLDAGRHPKLDRIFRTLLAATGLLALWGLVHPSSFPIRLSMFLALLSIGWVFATAWYLAYLRETNGKILALSWSFATLGLVSLAFYDAGLPSLLNRFPNLYEWAVFAEAILFSIALSRRISLTRRLAAALEHNAFLLSELNHRTKNNMQFLSSLYRMKLSDFDDPRLSERLREAEDAVWAIRSVHEMLYKKRPASPVDLDAYVVRLAERLKEGMNRPDVHFRIDVEAACAPEEAVRIGTLLNELITNAFKHAFASTDRRNVIEITLKASGEERRLLFRDNGEGCGEERGFGLLLVASIVEKELGGSFEKVRGEGCGYLIRWRRKTQSRGESPPTPDLSPA